MNLANRENASFDERGEFLIAARLEYLQDEKGIYGVSIPTLTFNEPSALTYILRPGWSCPTNTSKTHLREKPLYRTPARRGSC